MKVMISGVETFLIVKNNVDSNTNLCIVLIKVEFGGEI